MNTPLAKRKELFWEINPEWIPDVLRDNDGWAWDFVLIGASYLHYTLPG